MRTLATFTFALCALGSQIAIADASSLAINPGLDMDRLNSVVSIADYTCGRDDRGWHYMRGDRRISCRPARPVGRYWAWRSEGGRSGWWHGRENRWHD